VFMEGGGSLVAVAGAVDVMLMASFVLGAAHVSVGGTAIN
jgi:hypothetical protein